MTDNPSDESSARSSDFPEKTPVTTDELPSREPITPELVEDEAIRGDFVIRWAVVLFALLVATTEIAESVALVHVKWGEYLAAHGWLPLEDDAFSYTASNQAQTNRTWLFDLIAAGAHVLGGGVALSIFKAIIVAAAFVFIVRTQRAGVSTWWSSICAAAAVIACQARMSATPDAVTLLGLAIVLWSWHQWDESGKGRALAWLVPVFLVWGNLDARMFLGLTLLGLLAVGETLRLLLENTGEQNQHRIKSLCTSTGACVLAGLLNPTGGSLLHPTSLYTVEYPALRGVYAGGAGERDYSPISSNIYWQPLLPETAATLFLISSAVILIVLNRSRRPIGPLLAVCGFIGFAALAAHEIGAAALVCAVLAGLQAQDWYRQRFRQNYSIATSELVFSRGGRAATVLALLGLAVAQIGGRLGTPTRARAGVGINDALQTQIDDLRAHVADSFDHRPFNFYLEQGDLLIWVGEQPFIDSRIWLYARNLEGGDLIALHRSLRDSLRNRGGTDAPEAWKAAFDRYQVTHVLPKLSGANADYTAFLNLRRSPDWRMTKLTASTASLYRTDLAKTDATFAKYFDQHFVNFVREAFRTEKKPPEERIEWATSPVSYALLFQRPRLMRPNAIQLAMHYQRQIDDVITTPNVQLPAQVGTALAHLAIRNANAGLGEAPQSADGYRVLGTMYEFLGRLESRVVGINTLGPIPTRRFYQALAAYRQSITCDPNNRFAHRALAGLYSSQRKFDLAIQSLDEYLRLTAELPKGAAESPQDKLTETLTRLHGQMTSQVRGTEDRVAQLLQNARTDFLTIARFAYEQGDVGRAGRILASNPQLVAEQPEAQLLWLLASFEIGAFDQSEAAIARIEQALTTPVGIQWEQAAGMIALGRARYDKAIEYWTKAAENRQVLSMQGVLQSMPLVASPSLQRWPVVHATAVLDLFDTSRLDVAASYYERALSHIEAGRNEDAAKALREMLEVAPNTPLRPLAAFYLNLITGEDVDPRAPANQIPITPDIFTPEPAAAKPKP